MIKMMNSLVCLVVVLVLMLDLLNILSYKAPINGALDDSREQDFGDQLRLGLRWSILQTVEAKGVAGLGKAGGDSSAGTDKNGQQVPPEVYNALTYAGSAFLLTLSVPVILYTLNKLLNVIEDCFGCGPASRRATFDEKTRLASKREKEIIVKDMNNLTATTTTTAISTSQLSHLLPYDKQKLFNDLNGNLSHSLDINPPTTQQAIVNLNQNLLMSQPTTSPQELLLNPLTFTETAKDNKSNITGSTQPSLRTGIPPLPTQMIQNFQQQFIIS